MASEQPLLPPKVESTQLSAGESEVTGAAAASTTTTAPENAPPPVSAIQETPAASSAASPDVLTKTKPPGPTVEDENPPPKPPRPISPQQQAQNTLQEAFPSIDATVVRAVLIASGGQVEPAFNALLTMSDPSFTEEQPPPQPPRPRQTPRTHSPRRDLDYNPATVYADHPQRQVGSAGPIPHAFVTSTPQNQLEADEIYARQLAEHLSGGPQRPTRRGTSRYAVDRSHIPPPVALQGQQTRRRRDTDEDWESDKDHSFIDDDLPVIKENIRKGFLETQKTVNSWISDFKKKIDGNSPENSPPSTARHDNQHARSGNNSGYEPVGPRSRDVGYDADPRVLSDDFAHLELRDNSSPQASQSRRPKANPNLFQPSPISKSNNGRKVSFDERPTTINDNDDDDLYRSSPAAPRASSIDSHSPARQSSPGMASKWKPLTSVEPESMDKDPFSLGDSDDEHERDGGTKESESAKPVSITGPQESGVTK